MLARPAKHRERRGRRRVGVDTEYYRQQPHSSVIVHGNEIRGVPGECAYPCTADSEAMTGSGVRLNNTSLRLQIMVASQIGPLFYKNFEYGTMLLTVQLAYT